MNIHLRMLKVFTTAFLRQKKSENLLKPFVMTMRVWPMDLDFNLHKNNGRYLTTMDIGRMDLAFRAGLHKPMFKYKWMPLLGSSTIRYFKSLRPFQKFNLETRIVGWDDKWVFMEQKFISKGHLYAVGTVKVLFRGKEGNIPTDKLLKYAGIDDQSPDIPDWVLQWHHADRKLGETYKKY
ncbi:thioesterase family protein [Terasakiella pusilla]|uniref:thioesterase family protein n=1 Tax=Terasakiella pusilla TaxID=64973 RepID=UPI003AA8F447